MNKVELGYWVCASFQHLRSFAMQAENIEEFEVTLMTGELALVLNAIRGRGTIDQKEINRIAKAQRIPVKRLFTQTLAAVERLGLDAVVITRDKGNHVSIEEHLFSIRNLYEVVGDVWELLDPSVIERGAVHILKHTYLMPRTKTEQLGLLASDGLAEVESVSALGVSTSFKMVRCYEPSKRDDPVIFNPYIWRANHEKIAHALLHLPSDERSAVKTSLELVSRAQGVPVANLEVDRKLLSTAHSVGLLDLVEVSTATNDRREFAFSPHLATHPDTSMIADDLLNDVRAVLACVGYGENYSKISRLGGSNREKTINTLAKLLSLGEAGDATAIGVDYKLLEERGIITVVPTLTSPGGRFAMVLLRREPVEIALRIIRESAQAAMSTPALVARNNLEPGSLFAAPEATRIASEPQMGELPQETVEARAHFLSMLRKERF
jgi:hypothetical protein